MTRGSDVRAVSGGGGGLPGPGRERPGRRLADELQRRRLGPQLRREP